VKQLQRVGISEFRVATAPTVLVTYGLGSCLGIVLDDRERSLGGLAHTLLPAQRPGLGDQRLSKFVDVAIRMMLEELLAQGARRESLTARIAGGANMFGSLSGPSGEGIGARNARAARAALEALAIPLVAEDVGGSHGRTIEYDLVTGRVEVRSVSAGDKIMAL